MVVIVRYKLFSPLDHANRPDLCRLVQKLKTDTKASTPNDLRHQPKGYLDSPAQTSTQEDDEGKHKDISDCRSKNTYEYILLVTSRNKESYKNLPALSFPSAGMKLFTPIALFSPPFSCSRWRRIVIEGGFEPHKSPAREIRVGNRRK